MIAGRAANKHRIKWRGLFEANMWLDDDPAFCHARFCLDANRYDLVTVGFPRFRLVVSANSRARENFSGAHQISRGYLFSYNQTNCLRIHGCSECFSQVLDQGVLDNGQSARFDKTTLAMWETRSTDYARANLLTL